MTVDDKWLRAFKIAKLLSDKQKLEFASISLGERLGKVAVEIQREAMETGKNPLEPERPN
tara:strand:- start:4070 stop:4249 length:180 start_codon:yes stop_codon:yes gene_type:complete